MNKSEQINELASALCKAQGQIRGAIEDSSNPHFKSKYASLQSYMDSAREPLSKNGLAVTQLLTDLDCENMRMVTIETVLMHSSGQWISSTFSVPVSKSDAQGFGSAVTYARRYSFAACIGIAPMDDDGHAAVQAAPTQTKAASAPAGLTPEITSAIQAFTTVDELFAWAKEQKKYSRNMDFRNAVSKRKEELSNVIA